MFHVFHYLNNLIVEDVTLKTNKKFIKKIVRKIDKINKILDSKISNNKYLNKKISRQKKRYILLLSNFQNLICRFKKIRQTQQTFIYFQK